jgi:DNA-binding IclR family transcriptional regulator
VPETRNPAAPSWVGYTSQYLTLPASEPFRLSPRKLARKCSIPAAEFKSGLRSLQEEGFLRRLGYDTWQLSRPVR